MKKANWAMVSLVTVALLTLTGAALSSDDNGDRSMFSWLKQAKQGIDPLDSQLYTKECGSCHFPYQPGLLPATSWETIISNLDNHFGENAELAEDDLNTIRNFLLNKAAGRSNYGLPNKIMAAQGDRPLPLRITEMRYFLHEHSDIPKRMVQDNPKVKSFSNCDSCHQSAKQGLYDEHDVNIPGFGRQGD
ncbi:MAG: diheme cytochrome c [Sedimenticola sp.]|nr:diheme cytochrome c [Sedimenticola sp.]MCW8921080.1 diheme cytochrome c [Sedimenticola sp.]MCW8949970.1 diheme cytochrome c [Sedimenticola sp.]MDF1528552.1 diheme cytochrome c [Sedimenticola sp.]